MLNGGQLGYLALVLTQEEYYNDIPNTVPFIRPIDPGVFKYSPSVPTLTTPQEPSSPVQKDDPQEQPQVNWVPLQHKDEDKTHKQDYLHHY